jgi:hypothetical protein
MKVHYMSYVVTGVRKIYMYLLWYKDIHVTFGYMRLTNQLST